MFFQLTLLYTKQLFYNLV